MTRFQACLTASALALSGCAYDPPMQADHASAGYRKDLTACQAAGDKEGFRRVKASGMLFLTYPVSLPIEQRVETRKCLVGKGYHLSGLAPGGDPPGRDFPPTGHTA